MGCASSVELETLRRQTIDDLLQSELKFKATSEKAPLGLVPVWSSQDSTRSKQSTYSSVSRVNKRSRKNKVSPSSPTSTESLSSRDSRCSTTPTSSKNESQITQTWTQQPADSRSTTKDIDAWTSASKAIEEAEAVEMQNSMERGKDFGAYLAAGGTTVNIVETVKGKRNAAQCLHFST